MTLFVNFDWIVSRFFRTLSVMTHISLIETFGFQANTAFECLFHAFDQKVIYLGEEGLEMSCRWDEHFRAPSFDDINFSFQLVLRFKMPPKPRGKKNSKGDSKIDYFYSQWTSHVTNICENEHLNSSLGCPVFAW